MSKERKPASRAAPSSRTPQSDGVAAAAEGELAVAAVSPQVGEPVLTAPSGPDARPGISPKMEQLIALFREQNAVLAAVSAGHAIDPSRRPSSPIPLAWAQATAAGQQTVGVTLVAAPPSVAGTAPSAADGHPVDAETASARILEEVARVSGFPAGDLRSEQTIVADLGLDSLMITDLFTRLGQDFPQITVEPTDLSPTITVGELIGYLQARLGSPAPSVMASAVTATVVVAPAPTLAPPAPTLAPPAAAPAAVASEAYRIEEFPEVKTLFEQIRQAEELGLTNPYFMVNDGVARGTTRLDGREVINFSSYNYLGLSGHPTVVGAVQDAVARYGSSVSASRMLSGEKPIHHELESELAALLGTQDALVLVSGHATNVTLIGHLIGPGDLVIHDALAHNSILEGCKLSGATRRPFPHNDHAGLDALLGKIRHQYRRVLILIEGVYSMDGDVPDLPAFIAVKKKHHALLMIDEAHSIGVLGAHGAGIGEYFQVDRGDVELWAGTMSKSLASCGGYVAGSRELIRFLRYTTPGFIYSAGITPANTAAALAALRQMRAEPALLTRLHEGARLFLSLAKAAGIDTGDSHDSPVIPCILRNSLKSIRLSNALLRRGINVYPIMYPAVPEELSRLRFFVTASHTEEQIRYTVNAIAEELRAL
ncbi:MAG: hypothetical protein QOD06_2142, partial [Candidatus Binatota bacterium]|nr:hypothetical protein [Candidatus Binatota bacterium]